MLAGLAYYRMGVNVQPQKTRFRAYVCTTDRRRTGKKEWVRRRSNNKHIPISRRIRGKLALLHSTRTGKKARRLRSPQEAPPSAAGSTHDQLTAKQPVSETVSDVGGGRPEMKPYQPISGFMARVYMFHVILQPHWTATKGQAFLGCYRLSLLPFFSQLTIFGTRAEKMLPHTQTPITTPARPHVDIVA